MNLRPHFIWLFGCGATLACSSQVDTSTYRGEPLATLVGTVSDQGSAPLPPSIDAALVWADVQLNPQQTNVLSVKWIGESAPVVGQFPTKFTLNVYQPPPATARVSCVGSTAHLAFAFVVAVDATQASNGTVLSQVLGEAYGDMVVYVDSDEPQGWSCLPDLGFTFAPTKGYHLLQAVPHSSKPRAYGAIYPAYIEAPAGLATPITITLDSKQDLPGTGSMSGSSSSSVDAGLPDAPAPAAQIDSAAP